MINHSLSPKAPQNQATEPQVPFQVAWKLHTLGYSVIPSGGGESHKAPLVAWTDYQERQPTDEELQGWADSLKPRLWGIVTGVKSGVVVLDADTPESKAELEAELGQPHVFSPHSGCHWYFKHPGHHVKTVARVLPGIDIRGDGGFVNIAGSRPDGEYTILTLPSVDNLLSWDRLPERIKQALNSHKPVKRDIPATIPEGQRNTALVSLAGAMRRKGMSLSAVTAALLAENQERCSPPLPEDEVKGIAASVTRYPPNTGIYNSLCSICPSDATTDSKRHKNVTENVTNTPVPLAQRIEDWVKQTTGWFDYTEIDREFGLNSANAKHNRFMILQRLKVSGMIESHPSNNKLTRFVNRDVRLIDFKSAGMRKPLALRYPFGIEKYFRTYPGNIIVIAGAADSGKTAWLLNFIHLNQGDFSTFYQSSEMGKEELASRLQNFEGISLEDWSFTAEERSRDFADVIRPDCVNIIDYMELSGDFYNVGEYLREIHDKLAGGICLVAIQKKRGADLGRGGDFGLEKPRLYLSMDIGKCTIQKAKNWANPTFNPNGLTIKYKIVGGCKFIITEDWRKP